MVDVLLLFSWAYMVAGPLTGAYMATWAYEGKRSTEFFGEYSSERRRIYRVAHINCFVFPYMGIMWALTVVRTQLPEPLVTLGVVAMMVATVFMTLPLFGSLLWSGVRTLSVLGMLALLLGIGLISAGFATAVFG
ncbi:MAG: hypothetical protein AAGA91_10610 [Pseudomonadota bacterium]